MNINRIFSVLMIVLIITVFTSSCVGPIIKDSLGDFDNNNTIDYSAYGITNPEFDDKAIYIDVNNPHEGSLWSTQSRYGSLFGDTKARNVNDILTVNIVETTDVSRNASTQLSSSGKTESGITKFLGAPLSFGLDNFWGSDENSAGATVDGIFDPSIGSESENSYNGNGSTARKDKFLTTLSARVINVFPNGNMLIKGNREIIVNREKQKIFLVGLVRPEDVSAQNVVLSSAIADAKISITGKGVISEKQNPGYGSRVYEWIWPFK